MTGEVCHRFEEAAARFDAVHVLAPDGRAVGYHQRLAHWVAELAPEASVALRLAARCQHIRRWALPRSDFADGRAGYKQWRTELKRRHADEAEVVLRDVGYDDATVERVRGLLLKKGLAKGEGDVQLFEDAICLTFIERQLAEFASKHDEDKMIRIVQKTWKKMSSVGHAAALELAGGLDDATQALLQKALAPPSDEGGAS